MMRSSLILIFGVCIFVKFVKIECIPQPLISSSGMIPPAAATTARASTTSLPLDIQPDEEELTIESKRMERGSSFVIPISSNDENNYNNGNTGSVPTTENVANLPNSNAPQSFSPNPVIDNNDKGNQDSLSSTSALDNSNPSKDKDILTYQQPGEWGNSMSRIIGPVPDSLAKTVKTQAEFEKAILKDSENKFSEDQWIQPIYRLNKPKFVGNMDMFDLDSMNKDQLRSARTSNAKSTNTTTTTTPTTTTGKPGIKRPDGRSISDETGDKADQLESATELEESHPTEPPSTTTLSPEEMATAIPENLTAEALFDIPNSVLNVMGKKPGNKKETDDMSVLYKVGQPWKDGKIVGKLVEGKYQIPRTEVSFRVAAKLCQSFEKNNSESSGRSKRLYLWAPINQYIPLLHKGFPLREPIFAPECLKWVLRECRGIVRRPVFRPCTYWAPQRIHRGECGFITEQKSMIVNYRMPYFVPGNCPCTWPCTKRFDPIQRCRVNILPFEKELDLFDEDGDPINEGNLEIQENLVAQLCRGMKAARSRDKIVSIGWIPIRVEGAGALSSLPLRKKREASQVHHQHYNKLAKRTAKDPSSPTEKAAKSLKKPPKPTRFVNPDDGSIIEGSEGETAANRFKQIVAYDPDPQTLENNGTSNDVPKASSSREGCIVWRYKACQKDFSFDSPQELTRVKRAVRRRHSHRRRKQINTKDDAVEHAIEDNQERPIQHEIQSNIVSDEVMVDDTPKQDCGEWTLDISSFCIPEVVVKHVHGRISTHATTHDATPSEEEDENSGEGNSGRGLSIRPSLKRKVVKDPCPGTDGRFPCFLIRKRRETRIEIDMGNGVSGENGENENNIEEEDDYEDIESESESEEEVDTEEEEEQTQDERTEGPEKIVEKRQAVNSPQHDDHEASDQPATFYSNAIKIPQDPSCRCDWPCLPFFDKVNRCYDSRGNVMLDSGGRRIVPQRSFRKRQRDPVTCLNFIETDDIYCKIKEERRI